MNRLTSLIIISIKLVTVREGRLPCILIINGYLSKEAEEVSDWLSVVDQLYPENKVIHVRWNAGHDLANAVQDDKQLHGAILMGYSLGAKVACQALKNLDANTFLVVIYWRELCLLTPRSGHRYW